MSVVVEMAQSIIAENARIAQNQDEYQKRYDALMERYDAARARHGEVVDAITAKVAQSERLSNFIEVIICRNERRLDLILCNMGSFAAVLLVLPVAAVYHPAVSIGRMPAGDQDSRRQGCVESADGAPDAFQREIQR